jgi:acetylornithine/N-succinyldiaminopimelate aminotransferase
VSLDELRRLDERYVMPTYRRAGVEFVRGIGARLWDAEGREYLDFFAGLSVHNAGHCHPRIVEAIRGQATRLMGVSNLYYTEPGLRLAQRITESSLGGKVFLANTGAEASECAIKLVRKHAHARGIEKPEVVVLEGAFHGRTLAALAATPKLARDDLFGPLPEGFVALARDDPEALRAAVGESTAAVMIEPIQGEAGVWPISNQVLAAARDACDASGALLVLDEVQTGMGRTGSLWAYEQLPVRPDVMTAAKALGGGLPVGACVTTEELGDVFEPGDHGSTFAGAPVTAAAGLAAFDVIDDPDLLRSVRELSRRFCDELADLDGIEEVRGRGLMVGAGLSEGIDAPDVVTRALDGGLVINTTGPGTLRFLPPLTITAADVDEAVAIVDAALGSGGVRHARQRA